MDKFSKYFLMIDESDPKWTQKTVKEYVLYKTAGSIHWDAASMKVDIPEEHGNLNHVCRVYDDAGNRLYLKQAGSNLRISKDMTATLDRNRQESEILQIEERLVPGMVPHVYFYDTVMSACGMEDCSDYQVMRKALLKHEEFPDFAEHISTFLARTLLLSSDIVMEHKKKKDLVRRFINPDLDDITEKLVFTEPYKGADRNNIFPFNKVFVEKELFQDERLHLAVAKLKFHFMTNAEALLHGDLHTGSIFVTKEKTKVFDCEFGTYAPMGYDIGNIIANLIFAYANGMACQNERFCRWVLDTIRELVDRFKTKFHALYEANVVETMAKSDDFQRCYLCHVLRDTAGYAGTELHRRTVGMANVEDITSITDPEARLVAERMLIYVGKDFILNSDHFMEGNHYADALLRARAKAEETAVE